jgi:hypothetical protein
MVRCGSFSVGLSHVASAFVHYRAWPGVRSPCAGNLTKFCRASVCSVVYAIQSRRAWQNYDTGTDREHPTIVALSRSWGNTDRGITFDYVMFADSTESELIEDGQRAVHK